MSAADVVAGRHTRFFRLSALLRERVVRLTAGVLTAASTVALLAAAIVPVGGTGDASKVSSRWLGTGALSARPLATASATVDDFECPVGGEEHGANPTYCDGYSYCSSWRSFCQLDERTGKYETTWYASCTYCQVDPRAALPDAPPPSDVGGAGGLSPSLSATGRFVAFDSDDATLVAGDTNGKRDVFVRDRQTAQIERVSVGTDGTQGNGDSVAAAISGDGRYVAFLSRATTLVPGDTNNLADVFVRDRQTQQTTRVSVATGGEQAQGMFGAWGVMVGSWHPTYASSTLNNKEVAISADGRIVAFVSDAGNLVPGDTNNLPDVFVHDRQTGSTTRVSVRTDSTQMTFGVLRTATARPRVAISADGRFVAFDTLYPLVNDDTNGNRDVYVHDRQTGVTTRESLTPEGAQSSHYSGWPSISDDGRYVAFAIDHTNSRHRVIAVRDRQTGVTTVDPRAAPDSRNGRLTSTAPAISADGRRIVYADPLWRGLYVYDRSAGTTRRISHEDVTVASNGASFGPSINADGSQVAFATEATNILPGDVNGKDDVVVVDVGDELMANGDFSAGATRWLTFASSAYPGGITFDASGGVVNFAKTPGALQAVVFQETRTGVSANAVLSASFSLRNNSALRKRISVLVHDQHFGDLSVCTFWLPPQAGMQTYTMRLRTTMTWTNATISFYAATADGVGTYQLDNVSLRGITPGLQATECVDPVVPVPPGGAAGPDLIGNGSFSTGLSPWGLYGQIVQQIASGVFEFRRGAGVPIGVLLQSIGAPMAANQILTSTFELGNSSTVRKRVTVILHDSNFSDLSACTFWMEPGQPLAPYTMRTYATKAWANATLSFYPATPDFEPWIRLDNVTLRRTPGTTITGTQCVEPGAGDVRLGVRPLPPPAAFDLDERDTESDVDASSVDGLGQWTVDGFTRVTDAASGQGWIAVADDTRSQVLQPAGPIDLTSANGATLRLRSWLAAADSRAAIEVSFDGVTWDALHVVGLSDSWMPISVDLGPYLGRRVYVRFVFDAIGPVQSTAPDVWRIEDIALDVY